MIVVGHYLIFPSMCATQVAYPDSVNFSLFRKKQLKSRGNLVLVDLALFRLLVHINKRLFHLVSLEKTRRENEKQVCDICVVWKGVCVDLLLHYSLNLNVQEFGLK